MKKDDLRIYIVVPEKITATDKHAVPNGKTVNMVPGRLMAQCAHAARKLENQNFHLHQNLFRYQEITTIVLSVPNSKSMLKVLRDFQEESGIYVQARMAARRKENLEDLLEDLLKETEFKIACFYDTNGPLYGKGKRALTAIAIGPFPKKVFDHYFSDTLGHLELYK